MAGAILCICSLSSLSWKSGVLTKNLPVDTVKTAGKKSPAKPMPWFLSSSGRNLLRRYVCRPGLAWAAVLVKGRPASDFQGHLSPLGGLSWDLLFPITGLSPSHSSSVISVHLESSGHFVGTVRVDHWRDSSSWRCALHTPVCLSCLSHQSLFPSWSVMTPLWRAGQQSFHGWGFLSCELVEGTLLNFFFFFSP